MYMKFYIDETTRKVLKKFPDKAVDVANSCDPNKINAKQRFDAQAAEGYCRGSR